MRPIILGMNNPLGPDPHYALWPDPPGCAGWRLWKMLSDVSGAGKRQYISAFDRRNILSSQTWAGREAREAGGRVWAEVAPGQLVVVLGRQVEWALGLERGPLIHPREVRDVTVRLVPHPSGRNLFYNEPANRLMVGTLLEEIMTCA
jgi:hypothetical protein